MRFQKKRVVRRGEQPIDPAGVVLGSPKTFNLSHRTCYMAETADPGDSASDSGDADFDFHCLIHNCSAHFPEKEQAQSHIVRDHSFDEHLDALISHGSPETGE